MKQFTVANVIFVDKKYIVNVHIKNVHEKQRDYKCQICGKDFGLKQILERHLKIVHEKRRDYKCNYCSKEFSRKAYKEKHERNIHNIM